MKKFIKYVPYVCLLSYLVLLFFRPAQVADSIIVLGALALVGYTKYLESKEHPDYVKLFAKEFNRLDADIKDVKGLQGQVGLANKIQGVSDGFRF